MRQKSGPQGSAEKTIKDIRRECLDHLTILNATHLHRVLRGYANYYNNAHTHLSLGMTAPAGYKIMPFGEIKPIPYLGGLNREYAGI